MDILENYISHIANFGFKIVCMSVERIKNHFEEAEHPDQVAFWFVRHGESEENAKEDALVMHDTPLTDKGRAEAESIVTYLENEEARVTHIFSSPSARAKEFAEFIGSGIGLEVETLPGLNERDWGSWKDLPWTEVADKLAGMGIDERYRFVPENGESWEQMEERLFATYEQIAAQAKDGEDILIVTHRGCLRATLPVLARAGRDQHEDYSVPLASLSKFSFGKEAFDFVGTRPHHESE